MKFEIIIKNGKIVDGTGNPGYFADLGIVEGKIAKIGQLAKKEEPLANKEIDASAMVVSPGFIDIHSHADSKIPFDPKVISTIRQGITTLVVGNCGASLAPINLEKKALFEKEFSRAAPPGEELKITWETFGEYLTEMRKLSCSSNVAHLVGFNNIRMAVLEYENRSPTPRELEQMKGHVEEAMQAGAFGISTGLIYTPQMYTNTEEIIEMAKVVAKYGGLYFTHIRGEGKTVVTAVKEAIEIVEKSGCVGGQIAHHKISSKEYWGKSKETLRLIEEANERGISISCDQYPYNRGMTSLVTLLPPWVHVGGMEKILERLRSPEELERIKRDVLEGKEFESFVKNCGWDHIYLASMKTEKWTPFESMSIAEITKKLGKTDEFSLLCEILLDEEGQGSMTIESMGEEDIRRIMTGRYTMVGSDASAVAPTGPLGHGKPHPRYYGTYPRILGKYVREEGLLTLEDAIRRMTSFPAQRLGLLDRGLLREGLWADIVVFDPKRIIDRATFTDPHQFPEGIKHVIVNGQLVVENEKHLGNLPGKILKKPS